MSEQDQKINEGEEFKRDVICGGFSGICAWTVGHPFDSLKVRMQKMTGHNTLRDVMRATYQIEGFRGFYKGGTPPLVSFPTVNAIIFSSYEFCKRQIGVQPKQEMTTSQAIFCGCFAGFVNSFILSPIELIKCRLQL